MIFKEIVTVLILLHGTVLVTAVSDNLARNVDTAEKKFYISTEEVNWFRALVNCRRNGMELASLNSEQEEADLEYATRGLNITDTPAKRYGLWLGGTNLPDISSFQYYWLDGTQTLYTNWNPYQPDNASGIEHCLQFRNIPEVGVGWNDLSCNSKLRYVCQLVL